MNNQDGHMREEQAIALQASGEYMMNHIADVMEMVQDTWARHEKSILNEKTLIMVEAEVKAIAETLTQQASKPLIYVKSKKWFGISTTRKGGVS